MFGATAFRAVPVAEVSAPPDEVLLDGLQRAAFGYFLKAMNPANGLVSDTTREDSPASIAVVGFALASYPAAVERGWMTRAEAVARSLAALRFFHGSDQSGSPEATGYKGFYYHFLDLRTGIRVWRSELSMIDTSLLIAGALTASMYFRANTPDEIELRELVDALYRRIDWRWAQDDAVTIRAGLEARVRIPPLRMGRLQRGDRAVRARTRLADSPARGRLLPRMDRDIPVGEPVRLRSPVRGAALRASVLACVDRFSRPPGSLHAREALRLLREQPARDLRPARVRAA